MRKSDVVARAVGLLGDSELDADIVAARARIARAEPIYQDEYNSNPVLREQLSFAGGLMCNDPSLTRQSDKTEADVNYFLSRYGVAGVPQLPPVYSEVDFDVDLLSAHERMNAANAAYKNLPIEIRNVFPDAMSVARAIADGRLTTAELPKKEEPPVA